MNFMILQKSINKVIYIFVLITTLLSVPQSVYGEEINEEAKDEILIITSYSSDTKYTYDNITAFISAYQEKGGKLPVVVENMNITSLAQASQWPEIIKGIISKHPRVRLLVLLGGEAWYSFLQLKESSYKEIPTICAMASRYSIEVPPQDTDFKTYEPISVDVFERMKPFNIQACFSYEYNLDKGISLMKDFYPNMQHLAFISDNTYNGLIQYALIKKKIQNYPELGSTFIDGRKSTLDMAVKQLKGVPDNSVILIGIWRIDCREMAYVNNSAYAFTNARPLLPTFSLTSSGIGYWAIGGYVPNYSGVAQRMAQKAYEVVDLNDTTHPELVTLSNEYKFDAKKLEELGFAKKQLPENSTVINVTPSFFEAYKVEVQTAIAIILTLLLGLIVSLYYYFKTKILSNHLEESTQQLRADKKKLEESEVELLLAKNQAEEASRMKSAFVSNMSHEVRTPLNAIVGFSSLLINSVQCNKEQEEYASIIQTNSNLLLQLINDILDVSRLESGKLQFTYEWCDIVAHCQSMIMLVNQNKTKQIDIRLETHLESYILYTDPLRLQQIIMNLLNNSVKFTPDGGEIVLSFEPDKTNQFVRFTVTDTGCGIPEEKQQQVFDRFEKLNEFVQGTGLGLSICKLTIQHMGGNIWIDNSYKAGARFIFSHPIKNPEIKE
ncbi:MAG: HAMP domain-containing sensor histidine kinase [Bacteroides sp.]